MDKKKNQLKELVEKFQNNIKQYKNKNYNETEVRVDFVNPLFEILGWDVDNKKNLPQQYREVTHEASVTVKEDGKDKTKKPDYAFRFGSDTLFFLETKKPSVDIETDVSPAFQTRRYGWSGNLKISVLSNFEYLSIYDCGVRPMEDDDTQIALIARYNYKDYVSKFDEIYKMLSKESVENGTFDSLYDNIVSPFKKETFNEYFLKQIKKWRFLLGESVNKNNDIDIETLNICVQRILNRLIFLRICEDRDFEKYETIKNISGMDELKRNFEEADKKYDSGLFEMLEEDDIYIPDDVLKEILMDLYYPNNSYDFSVVDPYVIGQIYELFLDETLDVSSESIIIEKKPEVIDYQGTVNTPKNITDIIVENTLHNIIDDTNVSKIKELKIADICCGAGNFLLSAYEFLVNKAIEYYIANDIENAINKGLIYKSYYDSNYQLNFKEKREILVSCIYGVDIDPLAVEITKFSLLLKLLDNTSNEILKNYQIDSRNKILPNLDNNIKNGNSLIGIEYANYDKDYYVKFDLLKKLKLFNWEDEFNGVKFDAIIGNPPYIRVQNIVKYSKEEYDFYKDESSNYKTGKSSLLDKYFLFIEKGYSLLKENGFLGFIIPNKFMVLKYADKLRSFLHESKSVNSIINFDTIQVFKGRSTYTCILIMSKNTNETFKFGFVKSLNELIMKRTVEYNVYNVNDYKQDAWAFMPDSLRNKIQELNTSHSAVPLGSLMEIFVGMQTSADKIYIIEATSEDDTNIHFIKNEKEYIIEKGILKPCIHDIQIEKYSSLNPNKYIIYPYHYNEKENRTNLYSLEYMENNFPLALKYLKEHRAILDKRNMSYRNENNWFAYGRSQSLDKFHDEEHIVWPVLSLDANYVYDNENCMFTGGGNGPFYGMRNKPENKLSILYILALLNHWFLEAIVKRKSSYFRGGYYSHGKQYIQDLPIYKIDLNDESKKEIHDKIVKKVEDIMAIEKEIFCSANKTNKNIYMRSKRELEKSLTKDIDMLYNIDHDMEV